VRERSRRDERGRQSRSQGTVKTKSIQTTKHMGLLDSILGAMSGKGDASGQASPLIGVLSGLLAQSGGLQGLANKFSQSGQGDTFSSWVGMGENQSISSNQIQHVLGS